MKTMRHMKKNFLQHSADVSAGKPARRPEAARRDVGAQPVSSFGLLHELHALHVLHVSRHATAHIIAR
jgi:hypothetical protein